MSLLRGARCVLSLARSHGARTVQVHSQAASSLSWPSASGPVHTAETLPSSWYTSQECMELEKEHVLLKSWQFAGHMSQLRNTGDFITGEFLQRPYIVCRQASGEVSAFHNVCRHHAAAVAQGSGNTDCFVCPYHGWTYGLDGRLQRANRMKGVQGFRAKDNGLVPLQLASLGPLLFVNFSPPGTTLPDPSAWFGAGAAAALEEGLADPLVHVASRSYELPCNWKVFCDNYLDGGYHVEHAHKSLAGGLDLSSYSIEVLDRVSLQRCATSGHSNQAAHEPRQPAGTPAAPADSTSGAAGATAGAETNARLQGRPAVYGFFYPNLMVNRYGPWMDANVVVPHGHNQCTVHFEYFLEAARAGDAAFVASSLAASEQVQQEDIALCTAVQRGLQSPAYRAGRYAPALEGPMFKFHQLLYEDVMQALQQQKPGVNLK